MRRGEGWGRSTVAASAGRVVLELARIRVRSDYNGRGMCELTHEADSDELHAHSIELRLQFAELIPNHGVKTRMCSWRDEERGHITYAWDLQRTLVWGGNNASSRNVRVTDMHKGHPKRLTNCTTAWTLGERRSYMVSRLKAGLSEKGREPCCFSSNQKIARLHH